MINPLIRNLLLPILLITGALFTGWLLQGLNKAQPQPLVWDGRTYPPCSLEHGSCTATTPFGAMTLRFNPASIPLMKVLQLSFESIDIPVQQAVVHIRGINMDMGELVFPLPATRKHALSGQAILPVCSQQLMRWQALIYASLPQGDIIVRYTFETHRQTQPGSAQ